VSLIKQTPHQIPTNPNANENHSHLAAPILAPQTFFVNICDKKFSQKFDE